MYLVRQQGKTIEEFTWFVDAWLFAYLELDTFVRIVGPEGVWIVNPGRHTVN
jgi:hypothetical protein